MGFRFSEKKCNDAKKELARWDFQEQTREMEKQLITYRKNEEMYQKHIAYIESEFTAVKQELALEKAKREELELQLSEVTAQRDKYLAMLKKDSENSSKPPSTNPPWKKTVSMREKSKKKLGGQYGHKGHTLELYAEPTVIIPRMPESTCKCGGPVKLDGRADRRQKVNIRVETDIIEERSFYGVCEHCGKVHRGTFSEGFNNPVQYGASVKALTAYLGEYANVPINKVAETIDVLTRGRIRLSFGTVQNIYHTLSRLLEPLITDIKNALIVSGVLGADETGARVDGHLNWVQVFTAQYYTLYGFDEKRGELCVSKLGVLEFFVGVLVHDHFISYYQYKQMTHAECNAHILRYLKSVIQIFSHGWAAALTILLTDALTLKYQSVAQGIDGVTEEEYASIAARYDEILAKGVTEYQEAIKGKSKDAAAYYNDEKCLLTRLAEYKTEHLRFLTTADVPFSNNMSERAVGAFKRKLQTAGSFRSPEGADTFTRIISVIQTLKKQKKNVFEKLNEIFEGHANGLLDMPASTGGT